LHDVEAPGTQAPVPLQMLIPTAVALVQVAGPQVRLVAYCSQAPLPSHLPLRLQLVWPSSGQVPIESP
jgi:hypothetical protein